MTAWTEQELDRIGSAHELDLRSERSDGSLRAAVTMWVVRDGDSVYVRSVKGREGPWFRGAQRRRRGRIQSGGVERDVVFEEVDADVLGSVDAAYRKKYGAYTGIVDHVLTEQAREATLRLVPR